MLLSPVIIDLLCVCGSSEITREIVDISSFFPSSILVLCSCLSVVFPNQWRWEIKRKRRRRKRSWWLTYFLFCPHVKINARRNRLSENDRLLFSFFSSSFIILSRHPSHQSTIFLSTEFFFYWPIFSVTRTQYKI